MKKYETRPYYKKMITYSIIKYEALIKVSRMKTLVNFAKFEKESEKKNNDDRS